MTIFTLSFKKMYLLLFLIVFLSLIFDGYLQYTHGAQTCILGHLERFIMLASGVIFLFAALFNHTEFTRKLCTWFAFCVPLIGIIVASRHCWLQHFNITTPAIPLKFLAYLGLGNNLSLIGMSQCAGEQWRILGLSLAAWYFFIFLMLALVSFWQQKRR